MKFLNIFFFKEEIFFKHLFDFFVDDYCLCFHQSIHLKEKKFKENQFFIFWKILIKIKF